MLNFDANTRVLVLGPPGSHTTEVSEWLAEQCGLSIYSSNRFLAAKELRRLYAATALAGDTGWIMEGRLAYRYLRKHQQARLPFADAVVVLDAVDQHIALANRMLGQTCSISRIRCWCKMHEPLLKPYLPLDHCLPRVYLHEDSPQIAYLISGGPAGGQISD